MRVRIGGTSAMRSEKADGTVLRRWAQDRCAAPRSAEPGGVGISDAVRTFVRGKLVAAFDDQGEQAVKKIADPARAQQPAAGGR